MFFNYLKSQEIATEHLLPQISSMWKPVEAEFFSFGENSFIGTYYKSSEEAVVKG